MRLVSDRFRTTRLGVVSWLVGSNREPGAQGDLKSLKVFHLEPRQLPCGSGLCLATLERGLSLEQGEGPSCLAGAVQ